MAERFGAFVKSIYICPEKGAPMEKLDQVRAIPGLGLEGDRYTKGEGFWQTVKNPRSAFRHISLILYSDIENSGFEENETRRNLVISGEINLAELIGREFEVGEVRMRGAEICTPCNRPSKLSGKEGFEKIFKDEKGGLRAEIIGQAGIIYVGDELKTTSK